MQVHCQKQQVESGMKVHKKLFLQKELWCPQIHYELQYDAKCLCNEGSFGNENYIQI